ncbi:cytochrome P450, partial [Oryctes borbonicus]
MFVLIAVLSIICASAYLYFKHSFAYWRKKKVPYIEPAIPFGNLETPWSIPLVNQCLNYYKTFKKRGDKHGGIFILSKPIYMPVDPEFVKNVLIKDFHYFTDRGLYYNEEKQPQIGNLFFIEGQRWKNLRQKLTPTFTSGKMKMMFNTMLSCAQPLNKAIERMAMDREVFDAKDLVARFTTDVIGSCAFGIDCDSFENPHSDFRRYGDMMFAESPAKVIRNLIAFSYKDLAKKFGILNMDKDIAEFFTKVATDTYSYRKKNNIKRNDFMQLLMEMKDESHEEMSTLNMNEFIAQVILFFIAGFDTSSATLSFCLFSLASNLDIQEKLREEIKHVLKKHDGKITYDSIQDMKYMDQVLNETMRMYPIAPILGRICTEDYRVPSTDVVIEKGTEVFISPWGLQRDPDYFPDPDKFDPERFSDENKTNIVPGTYLPFGEGPRICIGLRFAMMQMKMCLAVLMKDFEFSVNSRTKVPLELGFGFIISVKGGIWLNV